MNAGLYVVVVLRATAVVGIARVDVVELVEVVVAGTIVVLEELLVESLEVVDGIAHTSTVDVVVEGPNVALVVEPAKVDAVDEVGHIGAASPDVDAASTQSLGGTSLWLAVVDAPATRPGAPARSHVTAELAGLARAASAHAMTAPANRRFRPTTTKMTSMRRARRARTSATRDDR